MLATFLCCHICSPNISPFESHCNLIICNLTLLPFHGPDGMAEWLRCETGLNGRLQWTLGSWIWILFKSGLSSHPAWSGQVPWSIFINVRDCLLFYINRLMLLVITCQYKQINFTLHWQIHKIQCVTTLFQISCYVSHQSHTPLNWSYIFQFIIPLVCWTDPIQPFVQTWYNRYQVSSNFRKNFFA